MARTRDYLAALCKGWQVEQVRQIVAETLHELINPYVYAEAAALIEEHQAAGRDVVLVSASGEEMVRPIGELLGVTDVIATRMAVADGRYSGEVEFYAAGPSKVEAVGELATERGYDLADSYAYSDSFSDRPLLECVGHPTRGQPGPAAAPAGRGERAGRCWSSATRSRWAAACASARPSRSPPPRSASAWAWPSASPGTAGTAARPRPPPAPDHPSRRPHLMESMA